MRYSLTRHILSGRSVSLWWGLSTGVHAAVIIGMPAFPDRSEPPAPVTILEVVRVEETAAAEDEAKAERKANVRRRTEAEQRSRRETGEVAGPPGDPLHPPSRKGFVDATATRGTVGLRKQQAPQRKVAPKTPAEARDDESRAAPARRLFEPLAADLSVATLLLDQATLARVLEATVDPRDAGRPVPLRRRARLRTVSSVAGALEAGGGTGDPDLDRLGDRLLLNSDRLQRHPYWRGVWQRVQPLWSFPKAALLRGEGGRVYVSFRLRTEDGSLAEVKVVRRSGVEGFDDNVVKALRTAGPFGPVPVDAPGRGLRIEAPFIFRNRIGR